MLLTYLEMHYNMKEKKKLKDKIKIRWSGEKRRWKRIIKNTKELLHKEEIATESCEVFIILGALFE